jgi:serine/threonine protein kinase
VTRIKVLDFGIARLNDPSIDDKDRTRTGFGMGTPGFMAPEQAADIDVDGP